MNITTHVSIWTLVAALGGGLALPAQARDGGGDCMMRQGPRSEQMQQRMTQRMEQRQTALKADLKLTPEQEPAWQSFVQAMKPPTPPMRPNPAELEAMTTPQRLEHMKTRRAEREAHLNQRMQAIQTFYAALTPAQQKVFDAQKPMRSHGHGHGHRHGGEGRGEG